MKLRIGYELTYDCPQPTPMILCLHVHSSRTGDLLSPDQIVTRPALPMTGYHDAYGNWCTRLVLGAGKTLITNDARITDSGEPDSTEPDAQQHEVPDLPEETLMYLLGSRYCDTDLLSDAAWQMFGNGPTGWARVQAICDYAHNHIQFDYMRARATMTASEANAEGYGVCRDFTHLAVTLCRCMNIPARYCTGYLSDIGTPEPHGPGDFAAWFEAYLGGRWHMFDPRNNEPRIGRVLMARGRDAADVAISNAFGFNVLTGFKVWTEPAA